MVVPLKFLCSVCVSLVNKVLNFPWSIQLCTGIYLYIFVKLIK